MGHHISLPLYRILAIHSIACQSARLVYTNEVPKTHKVLNGKPFIKLRHPDKACLRLEEMPAFFAFLGPWHPRGVRHSVSDLHSHGGLETNLKIEIAEGRKKITTEPEMEKAATVYFCVNVWCNKVG